MSCMHFLRKSTIVLLCCLLFLTLFGLGGVYTLRAVLGTPKPLEQALNHSGVYNTELHYAITKKQGANSIDGIPLATPGVQAAFEKAFPPSLLHQDMNQVLNGSYDWVQGKTPTPDFRVNLGPARAQLATYIAQYGQMRAAQLPVCTLSDLQANITASPYTATCLPPGVTAAAVAAQVKQQVLDSTILPTSVLNARTLTVSNQTIPQQYKVVPKIYKQIQESIYISLGVVFILALGIVFLHPNRMIGLRRVGATIFWAGLGSVVDAEVIGYGAGRVATRIGTAEQLNQPLASELSSVIKSLVHDLHTSLLAYGIVLLLIGAAMWLVIRFWPFRKRSPGVVVVSNS
jgi:hypothetical protein